MSRLASASTTTLLFAALLASACADASTRDTAMAPATGTGDSAVVTRRVVLQPTNLDIAEIIAGGQAIVGIDSATEAEPGYLAIADVGGRVRRIGAGVDGEADAVLVSPDDRYVATVRRAGRDVINWPIGSGQRLRPGGRSPFELRVVEIANGTTRTVLTTDPGVALQFYDWSPDGSHIIAARVRATGTTLELISVLDGSSRLLATLGKNPPDRVFGNGAAFSPDGRWILFDAAGAGVRRLHVIDVGTGVDRPLFDDGVSRNVIGWTPDGTSLLFATREQRAAAIWRASWSPAGTAGSPVLVRRDLWALKKFLPMRGPSIPYVIDPIKRPLYIANLSPDRSRIVGGTEPAVLSERTGGPPAWSPDGAMIAYGLVWNTTPVAIAIRNIATGDEQVIPVDLPSIYMGYWTADGRAIIINDERTGASSSYRVDLTSGKLEPLPDKVMSTTSSVTPPAGPFVLLRKPAEDTTTLVLRDTVSGTERKLYGPAFLSRAAISPDGKWVAVSEYGDIWARLLLIDAADASTREVFRVEWKAGGLINPGGQLIGNNGLSWTADSRHFVFRVTDHSSGRRPAPDQIWIATPEGKLTMLLEHQIIGGVRISPDGRRIAFNGQERRPLELWMLELPR